MLVPYKVQPDQYGSFIYTVGLVLKAGIPESCNGIAGQQQTWVHDVTLYIPGGAVAIKAAFTETLPVAGLLGMNGFFEHFSISFDPVKLECELKRVYRN